MDDDRLLTLDELCDRVGMSVRNVRFSGRFVRATSHPMGAAAPTHSSPTAAEVHSVVTSGLMKLWSSKKCR